ncbi:MAG: ATP-dependent metallopeptidase FtsH/Yme1/Tma family protein [Candidatus Kerfeldbacteria bacterium]|nr:ATP-dependent metallopeptidase FtsH/Yme1/Tma family protein [Candidatus Kerfeldbacteria bacterium]
MPAAPIRSRGPQLFRQFIIAVVVLVIIGAVFSLLTEPNAASEHVNINQLVDKIQAGEVKTLTIQGEQQLEVTLQDDSRLTTRKEATQPLTELLLQYGVTADQLKALNIQVESNTGWAYWLSVISPGLISIIVIGAILWFMLRQVQGMNNRALMFGKSGAQETGARDRKKQVVFNDVAGSIEAKQELEEVVDFLKNAQKYIQLGAKVPRGVLLVGPPGTGKTLLARAVAGEADVPFYHISGSEFVEMFVGVGASRVRDLFKKAKQTGPAIVFIDEIDAVGRQRGTGLGGSHDEREQTLNQILVEMDGFDNDTKVIVIAATNRPDVLDPALLRPGRFDRHVTIDLPDIKERLAILQVHSEKKPLESEVKLNVIAQRTPGFSGADLANILNEAAILAARQNKKTISQQDCLNAIEKVLLGPERRSSVMNPEEKRVTAFHEGGHAIVAHFSEEADPVHKVSIIARGRAGGYTLKLPEHDKHLHTKQEFLADLAVMLGGRVAEEEFFQKITTGASDDLEKATKLARRLVTQYGMSDDLGPRTFGHREELVFLGREISEKRDYSEETAERIDQAVDKLIKQAYHLARHLIQQHKDKLTNVAEVLIEKETLEREQFEALVA